MIERLTEPQAWRLIAEKIAKRGLSASGLCYEVDQLGRFAMGALPLEYQNHDISEATHALMELRIKDNLKLLDDECRGYSWFDTPWYDETRIWAALFLELQSRDELRKARSHG